MKREKKEKTYLGPKRRRRRLLGLFFRPISLGNSTGTPAGTGTSTRTPTRTGKNPWTRGFIHGGYWRVATGFIPARVLTVHVRDRGPPRADARGGVSRRPRAPTSGKTRNCGLLRAQELLTTRCVVVVVVVGAGIGIHAASRCSRRCRRGPVVAAEGAAVPPVRGDAEGDPPREQLLTGVGCRLVGIHPASRCSRRRLPSSKSSYVWEDPQLRAPSSAGADDDEMRRRHRHRRGRDRDPRCEQMLTAASPVVQELLRLGRPAIAGSFERRS